MLDNLIQAPWKVGPMSFQGLFQPGLFYGSIVGYFYLFFFNSKGTGSLALGPVTLGLFPVYLGWMLRVERVVWNGCLLHLN